MIFSPSFVVVAGSGINSLKILHSFSFSPRHLVFDNMTKFEVEQYGTTELYNFQYLSNVQNDYSNACTNSIAHKANQVPKNKSELYLHCAQQQGKYEEVYCLLMLSYSATVLVKASTSWSSTALTRAFTSLAYTHMHTHYTHQTSCSMFTEKSYLHLQIKKYQCCGSGIFIPDSGS